MKKRTRSELFASLVNGLTLSVLEHGFFHGDTRWNFKGIRSPFSRLYCTLGGDGAVISGGVRTRLKKGYAYLIPLNTVTDYTCVTHVEKFYAHFRLDAFPGRDIFDGATRVGVTALTAGELAAITAAVETESLAAIVKAKGVIFGILSRFISEKSDLSAVIGARDKYRELFSALSCEDFMAVRLSSVAEKMGMTLTTLSRNFKRDTGSTLTAYLAQKAIDRAREELILTDRKVKEIGARLGYADEFYFSRFFKKHVKLSPQEYRERNTMK